jgi:hypothetical protein
MRRLSALAVAAAAALAAAGCAMPVGRDFARPGPTTFKPGVTTLDEVKKALGEPRTQLAWSRNTGVFSQSTETTPLPTPWAGAAVGGTVKRLYYYYSWRLGEAVRSGVDPSRSFHAWFWNDKLVAFTGSSSFKADATGFDDAKVAALTPWKSLRGDVIAAFGPPSGLAVYPAVATEDHEVLIYHGFEWDTGRGQYESKSLFVVVDALGLVEDVRFSGSTRPIPPPAPSGGGGPVQIYTPPPRTRGR